MVLKYKDMQVTGLPLASVLACLNRDTQILQMPATDAHYRWSRMAPAIREVAPASEPWQKTLNILSANLANLIAEVAAALEPGCAQDMEAPDITW
jgi:hypothetical protein